MQKWREFCCVTPTAPPFFLLCTAPPCHAAVNHPLPSSRPPGNWLIGIGSHSCIYLSSSSSFVTRSHKQNHRTSSRKEHASKLLEIVLICGSFRRVYQLLRDVLIIIALKEVRYSRRREVLWLVRKNDKIDGLCWLVL